MEFDSVDIESMLRTAKPASPAGGEYSLMRNVVQCENRRQWRTIPAQMGTRQPARPVIHVQYVRLPANAAALPDLCRSRR